VSENKAATAASPLAQAPAEQAAGAPGKNVPGGGGAASGVSSVDGSTTVNVTPPAGPSTAASASRPADQPKAQGEAAVPPAEGGSTTVNITPPAGPSTAAPASRPSDQPKAQGEAAVPPAEGGSTTVNVTPPAGPSTAAPASRPADQPKAQGEAGAGSREASSPVLSDALRNQDIAGLIASGAVTRQEVDAAVQKVEGGQGAGYSKTDGLSGQDRYMADMANSNPVLSEIMTGNPGGKDIQGIANYVQGQYDRDMSAGTLNRFEAAGYEKGFVPFSQVSLDGSGLSDKDQRNIGAQMEKIDGNANTPAERSEMVKGYAADIEAGSIPMDNPQLASALLMAESGRFLANQADTGAGRGEAGAYAAPQPSTASEPARVVSQPEERPVAASATGATAADMAIRDPRVTQAQDTASVSGLPPAEGPATYRAGDPLPPYTREESQKTYDAPGGGKATETGIETGGSPVAIMESMQEKYGFQPPATVAALLGNNEAAQEKYAGYREQGLDRAGARAIASDPERSRDERLGATALGVELAFQQRTRGASGEGLGTQ